MRITQGYVSKSIMDFPFHQTYALDDYNSCDKPCVFFGMYRFEDLQLALHHDSGLVVFWTGQDALDYKLPLPGLNITAHPKIYKKITESEHNCQLVKPAAFLNKVQPQNLGTKIYAYCPDSAGDYHGWPIIKQLQEAGYDIVIGTGVFPQLEWRRGMADWYYNQCFIGLCLSEFAGGGGSIIEMGLRGMKVVTNVFDLPNCIPWNSLEGIKQAIEDERKLIGTTNGKLANQVWNDLDHQYKWLNI